MQTTGRVLDVYLDQVGTAVHIDTAAGETTLQVISAGPLDDEGGQVEILGDIYDYTNIVEDVEFDTIDLDPPLLQDVLSGDLVNMYPIVEEKTASVSQNDTVDDGIDEVNEPIDATIAPGLADTVALGQREDELGEYVLLDDESGEWQIVKVYGRSGKVQGEDVEGHLPIEVVTDGVAPDASPTPTLEPFAVGGLKWRVDPATAPNVDPVRFRVYADVVDPPTIDAAHLVYDGSAISGSFAAINGVGLLPLDPALLPVVHYVAVIQYDADGDGPLSATSAGATPRRAEAAEISANWVYAGQIQANQISAGSLLADYVLAGKITAAGGLMQVAEDGSITIFSASTGNPLVQLSPEGSVFRGRVEADDVSVLNGLVLQGVLSHIAPQAELTIDSVIGDPGAAPTLTSMFEIGQAWPAPPAGYASYGFSWDTVDSCWIRLISTAWFAYGEVKIQKINTSGVVTDTIVLTGDTGSGMGGAIRGGITRVGDYYYTTFVDYDDDYWCYLVKYTATAAPTIGSYVGRSTGLLLADEYKASLGNDGTDILVYSRYADSSKGRVSKANPTTLAWTAHWIPPFALGAPMWVGKGNFDFGADRIVINNGYGNNTYVFSLSGSTMTEDTTKRWQPASTAGFAHDGTKFVSNGGGGNLYNYGTYYPAASEKMYAVYQDTDGTDHTKASPIGSVALIARAVVRAILPPAPNGATLPEIYALKGTSTPALGSLLNRAEAITSRISYMDPSVAGSGTLTDTNTFAGAGTPGLLKTQDGGVEIWGDGVVKIPEFTGPTLIVDQKFYHTRGTLVGAHTIADNTDTNVAFDTWEGSSQNGPYWTWDGTNRRWTIQEDGLYIVSGGMQYNSDNVGIRRTRLFAGSKVAGETGLEATTAAIFHSVGFGMTWLTAGTLVYLVGFQNSGASLSIVGAGTWISIARMGGSYA